MTVTNSIVNRHMARLLSELEEAGCPAIFRDAVKSKFVWLRDDLDQANDKQGKITHESRRETAGNH